MLLNEIEREVNHTLQSYSFVYFLSSVSSILIDWRVILFRKKCHDKRCLNETHVAGLIVIVIRMKLHLRIMEYLWFDEISKRVNCTLNHNFRRKKKLHTAYYFLKPLFSFFDFSSLIVCKYDMSTSRRGSSFTKKSP